MPFLFRMSHSSGRHVKTYFRFQLTPNRLPDGFYIELSTEDIGSAISKKIGLVTEIEIGRPEFDSRYLIRTNNNLKAKMLLTLEAQKEIDTGMKSLSLGFIKFADGVLYTTKVKSSTTNAELMAYSEFFTRVCEMLEKV